VYGPGLQANYLSDYMTARRFEPYHRPVNKMASKETSATFIKSKQYTLYFYITFKIHRLVKNKIHNINKK